MGDKAEQIEALRQIVEKNKPKLRDEIRNQPSNVDLAQMAGSSSENASVNPIPDKNIFKELVDWLKGLRTPSDEEIMARPLTPPQRQEHPTALPTPPKETASAPIKSPGK